MAAMERARQKTAIVVKLRHHEDAVNSPLATDSVAFEAPALTTNHLGNVNHVAHSGYGRFAR